VRRFYGVNVGSCDNLPLLGAVGPTYVGLKGSKCRPEIHEARNEMEL